MHLRTPRLILRDWRDSDLDPLARLNADPEVMRYFPSTLSRAQSDAFVSTAQAHLETHSRGPLAIELSASELSASELSMVTRKTEPPDSVASAGGGSAGRSFALNGRFIGFAGLYRTTFAPWVEILWRIAKEHHNQGYATEAARAILNDGFTRLNLEEVVAFTVPHNLPSRRVMEKLGMKLHGEFDHPKLPRDHPLCRQVLYRMRQCENASKHHRLV